MKNERLHKGHIIESFDPSNTYVKVDSNQFRKPSVISLENVGKGLKIKIEGDLSDRNLTSVEFSGQDLNPTLPPDAIPFVSKTHIAVDENFLYLWIPKLKRLKRMMLSDW